MPRHGPIQGKPSSRLRLPDHAITILPPPLADLVVRDSKLSSLIRTELVDDRTGKTVGLTFLFYFEFIFSFSNRIPNLARLCLDWIWNTS